MPTKHCKCSFTNIPPNACTAVQYSSEKFMQVHVEMTKQELDVPCAFGILVHVCICFSGGSGNTIWLNWACCFKDCAQQTNQISVSHTPCEKQSTPVTGEHLGSSTVLRCHQLDTGICYTFWLLHSLNVMTNRC